MKLLSCWLSIALVLAWPGAGAAAALPRSAEKDSASVEAVNRLLEFLKQRPLTGSAQALDAAKTCYRSLGKQARAHDVRVCVVQDYLVCRRVAGYCRKPDESDSDWGQYRKRVAKAVAAAGIKVSDKLLVGWESLGLAAYERQVVQRHRFVLPPARAGVAEDVSAEGKHDAEVILSRGGVIDVVRDEASESMFSVPLWIRFRGKKVLEKDETSGFGDHWSSIQFTHLVQVGDDDVVLGVVEGNASAWCLQTASFMLVVKPDGRTFLEVFGCNTDYEASVSGNVLSVRHRFLAQDVGVASQLLIYDGSKPYEVKIHESEDGARVAGSGKDALRWVGKYPDALFDDPGERLRFLAIMDRKELRETRNRLYQVDGPVLRQGAVICARGWTRYWGSGAVGIEIASGKPFAWYEDIEADKQQSFGMEALAAPEDARKCVEGK